MDRCAAMDNALKEALQDALPVYHPGHVPDNDRIENDPDELCPLIKTTEMNLEIGSFKTWNYTKSTPQ